MALTKPAIFVPTLYFAEGLPYTVVIMMAGVFFKTLGASNLFIGLTTLLYWPWVLKFAWSPFVDLFGTKKKWIVTVQIILCVSLALVSVVAFTAKADAAISACVAALVLCAFASATQDVAIDGYYLDVLDDEQKAFFVGVRNTAYKVAWLFGSGAMVYLAGSLSGNSNFGFGWGVAFAICSATMLGAAIFHKVFLPETAVTPKTVHDLAIEQSERQEHGVVTVAAPREFLRAIGTYFKQPSIIPIVFYILTFRLGDALMMKLAPLFLLDKPDRNGLAIPLADMGIISGTVGVIALLGGGILGSWLISRFGLRKCMWPFALLQNGAILFYWALAAFPTAFLAHAANFNPHLPAVYAINSIENFTYGMGVAAYTVFLMTTVRSEYKAAHYATATALMALGMMAPGVASGFVYERFGYANSFLISFFASLPGIFAIFFLPIWKDQSPIALGESGGDARAIQKAGQVGNEG